MSEGPSTSVLRWPLVAGRLLGLTEVALGLVMVSNGLRIWVADDSMSIYVGGLAITAGLAGFFVPGCLLFLKTPIRWALQCLPIALCIWAFPAVRSFLGIG